MRLLLELVYQLESIACNALESFIFINTDKKVKVLSVSDDNGLLELQCINYTDSKLFKLKGVLSENQKNISIVSIIE